MSGVRAADPPMTSEPAMVLLDRWRRDLAAWAIPDHIRSQVSQSPWVLPRQMFARRAERQVRQPFGISFERERTALEPPGEVLDVGAGAGAACLPLAPHATRITAGDVDHEMLGLLTASAARPGTPAAPAAGPSPQAVSGGGARRRSRSGAARVGSRFRLFARHRLIRTRPRHDLVAGRREREPGRREREPGRREAAEPGCHERRAHAFTRSRFAAAARCLSKKAPMISKAPMTANQIPSSVASTVKDVTGADATTIPAIRLTSPKKIHQPRPWREPPDRPAMRETTPWTIQTIPTISPMIASVRCT